MMKLLLNAKRPTKMAGYFLQIGSLILVSGQAFAGSLTVRDIKLLGQNKVEITLDGTPPKGALEIDYVRDIVQFSIQNATIYPSKILHTEEASEQTFNKVFAYQYAPSLVRVRFSVAGKADAFQGKVKWEQKGKSLTLTFPASVTPVISKKEDNSAHEKSLLAKVLGQSPEAVKVEKIEEPKAQTKAEVKAEVKAEAKAEMKAEAQAKAEEKIEEKASEVKAETKGFVKHTNLGAAPKLGGASSGASGLRSFLAMLLVVGGLGCVLIYVKRKKGSAQAKKVGNSWISNLISGGKNQKALIEVIGTHALGAKQSITIVRIRGQQLVLGVTEGNVQLITQLDSDEDIDIMDDPKVADSLGKIFGAKPTVQAAPKAAPVQASAEASFNAMLKGSTGAGAIVARNAYQASQGGNPTPAYTSTPQAAPLQSSVRDQIRQRLHQQGTRHS